MDEVFAGGSAVKRLIEGIERQVEPQGCEDAPPHHHATADVNDAVDADEGSPVSHVGGVCNAESVRGLCREVSSDEVCGAVRELVGHRRSGRRASNHTLDLHRSHESFDLEVATSTPSR
jgi:hypothetical protein